jgi:hypothetical protein
MITKDILAAHYAEYASQPDEWVQNMEQTKRSIVKHVLRTINFPRKHEPLKVVVLGASDKRYIPIHQKVFASVTGQKVQMVTFDIDSDHLGGISSNVIFHDVTESFPGAPYDIVFSHELMKFLTTEEQLAVLQRSYEALAINGVAMHIVHEPSILGTPELRNWQYRVSPPQLVQELNFNHISARLLVFESESTVEWLRKTTVIVLQKSESI